MRKDQEPTSINAYLRQKRQVAEAEATSDVLTEQDDALDAPVQQEVGSVDLAFCVVERVAFAALSVVVRVQVLPATRNQLVVTHSGEPRYLLAVRASEWFARVAAPGRRLADQPDLVRLDLFVFHVNNSNGQLCKLVDGNSKPLCGRPLAACFVTRGHLENRAGRKHAFQAPFLFYGNDGTKFLKNCPGRLGAVSNCLGFKHNLGLA